MMRKSHEVPQSILREKSSEKPFGPKGLETCSEILWDDLQPRKYLTAKLTIDNFIFASE